MAVNFSKIKAVVALVLVASSLRIISPVGWDYLSEDSEKVTRVCTEKSYLYDYYANSRTPYKHKICTRRSLVAGR